jgi:GntR family transcriptional regulator
MITFRLNTHSGVPPYLQIIQQVKQALQLGVLQEGDRLPTVKEVVAMIAINPNTVAKAYRELESRGLTDGRAGSGTFIRSRPQGPEPAVQTQLAENLSVWVATARTAGLDEEAIEAIMREVLYKRSAINNQRGK